MDTGNALIARYEKRKHDARPKLVQALVNANMLCRRRFSNETLQLTLPILP